MPFNSLAFLLVVLPAVLALHALCLAWRPGWRPALLLGVSLAYYAWWDPRVMPLLLASAGLNWAAGEALLRTGRRAIVAVAIGLDLAVLGLFKYLGFFADLVDAATGATLAGPDWVLPLGLSFLTFQHVAYLVDLTRGTGPRMTLAEYALTVAFFPRVIAGPLVRPAEIAPQWRAPPAEPWAELAARGLLLLAAGLAKKVLLGDALAGYVDPVWAEAASGPPGMTAAAQAVLGYALQLYFDFSGYTDMALGLALMLGVRLPENFLAPYRAVSIQDFWRRWHVTLSLFLRDYLYVPLGGSRHGLARQVLALVVTMGLGGLWHGAGLTFVAWGLLHGLALSLHLLWRRAGRALPAPAGWALTLAFVILAWVPFRAPDFAAADAMLRGLVGFGGAGGGAAEFWPLAALAFALAVAGPTAREATARLPLGAPAAAATALALAAVILQVGNDANQAFIYARF
ncbi:MBOAT family O-acyltransferase [Methylobacterium sp. JK268]